MYFCYTLRMDIRELAYNNTEEFRLINAFDVKMCHLLPEGEGGL